MRAKGPGRSSVVVGVAVVVVVVVVGGGQAGWATEGQPVMQGKTKPSPTVSSAALASPGQRRRSQPGEVTRRVASPERSLAVVKSQKGLPVARSGEWFASRRAERRRWRGLYGPDDGRTSKGVTGENDANPFRAQSRPVPAPVPVPSS